MDHMRRVLLLAIIYALGANAARGCCARGRPGPPGPCPTQEASGPVVVSGQPGGCGVTPLIATGPSAVLIGAEDANTTIFGSDVFLPDLQDAPAPPDDA